MPIHDQSYRRYAGTRRPPGQSWWVIARAGIRTIIRKRRFLGLLLLAWLPFLVRAVQVYLSAMYGRVLPAAFATTAKTFHEFLQQQEVFVFFITIWVGAGLIANDRRANALQIYLSKPLARAEYVVGKLVILASFLLLVTWVPGLLLLILQMLFSGNFSFVRSNLFLFPAITLHSFLLTLVASFVMLALSSLSKSSRYVAILYAGVVFFSQAVYGVLFLATGSTALSWISVPSNIAQVARAIFRLPPEYSTPWPVSLLVLGVVMLAAIVVLERRVRGVEVVA
jgi:ABC-type transport system involved in multi-copper enzyme maturation permease subunit